MDVRPIAFVYNGLLLYAANRPITRFDGRRYRVLIQKW